MVKSVTNIPTIDVMKDINSGHTKTFKIFCIF